MAPRGCRPRPALRAAALVLAVALPVSGCAGSLPDDSADAAVTLAITRGAGGNIAPIVEEYNAANPDARVGLVHMPADPNAQRTMLVQDLQARTGRYDILYTDVVWTSEFVERGWLEPLDAERFGGDDYLPAAVETVTHEGTVYAAPFATGTGMLYYRSDLVDEPPTTWEELTKDCAIAEERGMDCYGAQLMRYEGLMVNASEAVNSAGGAIMTDDGEVTVDSPEARAGVEFLAGGLDRGYIPQAALTYMEDEARLAFQRGDLLFMRNWAFAWPAMQEPGPESTVQGKFDAAPLPGLDGPGVGTLGGNNLAISAHSQNKEAALRFLEYIQTPEIHARWMAETNTPTAWAANYGDEELMASAPHLQRQYDALQTARPRPRTPVYNDVTNAVQKHLHRAFTGERTVEEALAELREELETSVASAESR